MSQLSKDLQHTDKKDKIPVHEKIAYGLSDIPNNMPNYLPAYFSQQVFVFSLGLPATFITTVLALFRLVDAFTDPLIGYWSDNFRSKWGRRRPFMAIGTVATAISLPLIYLFPRDWSDLSITIWFFIFGSIFFFCSSLYNIPFQSLAMEMTPDYNERTSIHAYKAFVSKVIGLAGGWIWYLTQLPFWGTMENGQPDTLTGVIWIAFGISALAILVGFIPVTVCKERYYETATKAKRESFWRSFSMTIKCKPFAMILLMLVFLNMPTLVNGLGAYLTTYQLFGGVQKGAAFLSGIGTTISLLITMAAIPFTAGLCRRFGKERVLKGIILFNIPIAISYWLIYTYADESTAWVTILPGFLNAPLVTGFWMVLPSMQADIIDYDELKTGERREGTFAAVFSWFLKFSAVFMVGFSGPIIDLIGFDPALMGDQPEGVFFKMKLLITLVPILAVFLQLWILKNYPITPAIAHANREALEKRRGSING